MEKISPLAKAVIRRSLGDLESAIRLSPESLLERTCGLTVLHLCVGWPSGLSLFLETDAGRQLLNTPDIQMTRRGRCNLAWPFSYAAANQCSQSLNILLEAGCNLYPVDPATDRESFALSGALEVTSAECAEVFASHMARRREKLISLAKSNLDKLRGYLPSLRPHGEDVLRRIEGAIGGNGSDKEATASISDDLLSYLLVLGLKNIEIPVPQSLQPSSLQDQDIYQLPGLPLQFFPIFERHGFAAYNAADSSGLRPIMNDCRSFYCLSSSSLGDEIQDVFPWLIAHGCLDAKPISTGKHLPSLRINTEATGWHYLSMKVVTRTWGFQKAKQHRMSKATMDLVATIAEGEAQRHHDRCVCWCTIGSGACEETQSSDDSSGSGCSPFSFLCKAYIQDTFTNSSDSDAFRHVLFRHGHKGCSNNASSPLYEHEGLTRPMPILKWQLELLRLLTFEALEMTHTCCSDSVFWSNDVKRAIFNFSDLEDAHSAEADKSKLLVDLMVEFTEALERNGDTAQDLERFIFGPWKTRISGLYKIDDQEVNSMEHFLGGKVLTSKSSYTVKPWSNTVRFWDLWTLTS